MSDQQEGHETYHGHSPEEIREFSTWEERFRFAEENGDTQLMNSLLRQKPKKYSAVRSGGMRLPSEDLGAGTD